VVRAEVVVPRRGGVNRVVVDAQVLLGALVDGVLVQVGPRVERVVEGDVLAKSGPTPGRLGRRFRTAEGLDGFAVVVQLVNRELAVAALGLLLGLDQLPKLRQEVLLLVSPQQETLLVDLRKLQVGVLGGVLGKVLSVVFAHLVENERQVLSFGRLRRDQIVHVFGGHGTAVVLVFPA
jgi:hypothetical protein